MREAKDYVAALKALDLEQASVDEVKNATFDYFPFLPVACGHFQSDIGLIRVRENPTNQPYETAAEIGMPPAQCLGTFGRANRPHSPAFYGSAGLELALAETCINASSDSHVGFATVGRWLPRSRRPLALACIIQAPRTQAKRPDLAGKDSFLELAREMSQLEPDGLEDVGRFLLEHIAGEFARDDVASHNDYKLSVAYAERLLCPESEGELDGILYPSVAKRYEGDNIVLRASTYRELELVAVHYVSFATVTASRTVVFQFLSQAVVTDDGRLNWR